LTKLRYAFVFCVVGRTCAGLIQTVPTWGSLLCQFLLSCGR